LFVSPPGPWTGRGVGIFRHSRKEEGIRVTRRKLRNYLGRLVGIQADMHVWWTPELPLIYVSNSKSGCSTIKQSLKTAQAEKYAREGRPFVRHESPHADDECMRRSGLTPARCRDRYLFSCVRNPFARVLSAYLDKVETGELVPYARLRGPRPTSFEGFLREIATFEPIQLNDHFRPQRINLNYPKVAYDAVFFLENPRAITLVLEQITPGFRLERYAPHARGAAEKLAAHYNSATIELVREIYAEDFESFGYSRDLDDALLAPGALICGHELLPSGAEVTRRTDPARPERDTTTLEHTLRMRWLVERRLI
jgi:hypothetical protein